MKDPHIARVEKEPLARWAGNVLGQLPPRPAPPGLVALILADLRRRQAAPWYQQSWRMWSGPVQMAAAVLIGGIFAAVWWFLLPQADAVSLSASQAAAAQLEVVRPITAVSSIVASIGKALLLVLRSFNTWALASVIGILVIAWSTALGLGTACWRMAGGGHQDP